jgi:RHS repeat-associated protein
MPGALPPTSAYTYAVELSVDEAKDVTFDKPVSFYVENFLGFPVGSAVPTGYYDRDKAQWVASKNGRVIKILDAQANIDTDGDGKADNAGIDAAERAKLATLYQPGQELWRVEITHFTPWDCNWPFGPPENAIGPNGQDPRRRGGHPPGSQPDCDRAGSRIGCLSQTLGEGVQLIGTPYRLRYSSGRAPGNKANNSVVIGLSGDTVPDSLKRIELELEIAGRQIRKTFPAQPNQTYTFTWDGKDVYGHEIQGEQLATARIDFVYGAVYYPQTASFENAFARVQRVSGGGSTVVGARGQTEVRVRREWQGRIGGFDASAAALGGWTLSAQHFYAPLSHTLYRGDGGELSADPLANVADEVAGGFLSPHDIAIGSDGSLYVADVANDQVYKQAPDGTRTTLAGRGQCTTNECFNGDGGPATEAQLRFPYALAVAPDGGVYIADNINNRIRLVTPDGKIRTVAGGGTAQGENVPATQAQVVRPGSLALAPDGSLYYAEQITNKIRRIGPDGLVTTVAGGGFRTTENVPATEAALSDPTDVAVGPDGSIYITEWSRNDVRRVTPDGIIKTVAGNRGAGFSGDGGAATLAQLKNPYGTDVAPDRSLYVSDEGNRRVRRITPDGIITTFAGGGTDTCDRTKCPDHLPAGQATILPTRSAIGPDGDLYVVDRGAGRVRRIGSALPGFTLENSVVADRDGNEVYIFGARGRHVETRDALTNQVLTRFGYDSAGRLITVTDANDRVTKIERDDAGKATAIVAPGGQRTELASDARGHLETITSPAGQRVDLTTTAGGLLTRFNDNTIAYDEDGNLIRDGRQTLKRESIDNGWTVAITSAGGKTTTYGVQKLADGAVKRWAQDAAGETTTITNADGTAKTTYPTGSTLETKLAPDPRFGMQAPIQASVKSKLPSGKTSTMTGQRQVQLSDAADPTSLVKQTDVVTVNGRQQRSEYDAATRTLTTTSTGGRTTTRTYDADGRLVKADDTSYTYTPSGLVDTIERGDHVMKYGYDAAGRVTSKTDPAGTATYSYDAANRVKVATLPGNRRYEFSYDANGNRAAVKLSGGGTHEFHYSDESQLTSFKLDGSGSYTRAYDDDGLLTKVTLPSGRHEDYSPTGITFDEGTAGYETDGPGRLLKLTRGNEETAFSYDGELVSKAGGYSYDYDADLNLTGMQLDGQAKEVIGRDGDGLITALGPFTFTRGGAGGLTTKISDGTRTEEITYDSLGRTKTRTFTQGAKTLTTLAFDYDGADRIIQRRDGATTTDYAYDDAGRLKTVKVNGELKESYSYDAAGNRTGGAESYDADGFRKGLTYSARGELLQSGGVTFTYDGAGRRVSRTVGGVTTKFLYGNPENSLQVTATDGPEGVTTYYYDDASRVFAFERAGARYFVTTDQVGSATQIVDKDGTVVKAVSYDSFGKTLADSNPSFAYPFGFAGGLADAGLVRFGMRDYDPETGRWTARDPSLDSSNGGNLYAYVGNDPVNHTDPAGLWGGGFSAYDGVGGGLKLNFTSEGMSWCGELGFGVGVSAEIDPSDKLDKETIGLMADAKLDFFGLANVKLKGEVTNPCGLGAGPRDGDYDTKFGPEGCVAWVCTNGDSVKGKFNPQKLMPKFKPEIGLSAKAGFKVCQQIKW